jgi:hypothetical protein
MQIVMMEGSQLMQKAQWPFLRIFCDRFARMQWLITCFDDIVYRRSWQCMLRGRPLFALH